MTVTMMFYLYDSQWKNVSNKPAEMNRNSKDEILRPVTEYGRPDGIHNKDIRNTWKNSVHTFRKENEKH